jgi:hypothetical protein
MQEKLLLLPLHQHHDSKSPLSWCHRASEPHPNEEFHARDQSPSLQTTRVFETFITEQTSQRRAEVDSSEAHQTVVTASTAQNLNKTMQHEHIITK